MIPILNHNSDRGTGRFLIYIFSLVVVVMLYSNLGFASWHKTELLSNDVYLKLCGVSDDGTKILYIADTDNNRATIWDREVFLYDLNNNRVTRITRNVEQEVTCGLSGNGNVVAYAKKGYRGSNAYLFYYVVDLSNPSNVKMLRDWHGRIFYLPSTYSIQPIMRLDRDGNIVMFAVRRSVFSYSRHNCLYSFGKHDDGKYKGGLYTCGVVHYDFYKRPPSMSLAYIKYQDVIFAPHPIFRGRGLENKWIDRYFIQPISISNNDKVAFSVYSPHPEERSGIFLYDHSTSSLTQLSSIVPQYLDISGDGNYLFVVNGSRFIDDPLLTIQRMDTNTGENEIIYKDFVRSPTSIYYRPIDVLLTNTDGSKVFMGVFDAIERKYKVFLFSFSPLAGIEDGIHSSGMYFTGDIGRFYLPDNPSYVLEYGSAESQPNEEIQIPIKLTNRGTIGSADLILGYPSDILEVKDVLPGSLTQDSLFQYNVIGNNITIGIVDDEGIADNGTLAYIKFKVKDVPLNESGNETLNSSEVLKVYDLPFVQGELTDLDGNKQNTTLISGTFTLVNPEEALKGDVNGDGKITSLDALLALQMSVGKIEQNLIADMNEDGRVKADDALEILKLYLLNQTNTTQNITQLLNSSSFLKFFKDERMNWELKKNNGKKEYYAVIVKNATITYFEKGKLDNPTLLGYIEERTINKIKNSKNKREAIMKALDDGEIKIEYTSKLKTIKLVIVRYAYKISNLLGIKVF